jgi:hypothetical protein
MKRPERRGDRLRRAKGRRFVACALSTDDPLTVDASVSSSDLSTLRHGSRRFASIPVPSPADLVRPLRMPSIVLRHGGCVSCIIDARRRKDTA